MTSSQVATNSFIFMGAYDISGTANSIQSELGADELDATTLGDTTRNLTSGLKRNTFGAAGFVDLANYDGPMFTQIGGADTVLSYGATKTAGSITHTFQANAGQYNTGAEVGQLLTYDLSAFTSGDLAKGILLENVTGITTTGQGTEQNWIALAAGETLVAALHVFSVAGGVPNLELELQSDSADTFASPATPITFDAVSVVGSQYKTLAGAQTDTYYRINRATVSGTFAYAVVIGKY